MACRSGLDLLLVCLRFCLLALHHVSANTVPRAEPEHRGIFGVPLIVSIPYANVAISLFHETGESYIYGYVPIVVAKCGVYLKEKGTAWLMFCY
jgi:hypothetical protein